MGEIREECRAAKCGSTAPEGRKESDMAMIVVLNERCGYC